MRIIYAVSEFLGVVYLELYMYAVRPDTLVGLLELTVKPVSFKMMSPRRW